MNIARFLSSLIIAVSFLSSLCGQSLKVDFGMATGRNDTAADGWVEWQVPNGKKADKSFGDIQLRLRVMNAADDLRGTWYKRGLATGAVMATDGITAEQVELTIEGLAPGRHTLATWHNGPDREPLGSIRIVTDDGSFTEVMPTHRCDLDSDAATGYLGFSVPSDGNARFVFTPASDAGGPVVLNGLEINGGNPALRTFAHSPFSGDLHVDGDTGAVQLSWQGPPQAEHYAVYFTRANSAEEARSAVETATTESSYLIARLKNNQHTVKVEAETSEKFYAWRVDVVERDGAVTRGEVLDFRVRQLAFPAAEGYGRFAVGGRAGRVIKVTSLEDSGPGTLREAIEAEGPRTIVFDISGRIDLKNRLVIRNPYLTIAGHTAPGKGVCISNYNLGMMGTHDVIIRHLRVRPGDTSGKTLDGMGMASSDHCIIDHCSISWTQDEAFSSRGAKNITLQRTLISEALNIAGHKKYKAGTQHGYAASISGDIGSFHYNLLAHCAGRNWSLAGGLDKAGVHCGRLDIRNNVVYNWSHRTTDGGAMEVNFVNNYYKPGPATRVFHVLKPERNPGFGPQSYFVSGNVMEGHYDAREPLAGLRRESKEPLSEYIVEEPFFPSYVKTVSAEEAYRSVLSDVGANLPVLNDHDKRIIEETLTGSVTYKGSVSGLPGLPDSQTDVGSWEVYPVVRRAADWDIDGDGIPGLWEVQFGLDPENPRDGAAFNESGYTNLETYLHWLAAGHSVPSSLIN